MVFIQKYSISTRENFLRRNKEQGLVGRFFRISKTKKASHTGRWLLDFFQSDQSLQANLKLTHIRMHKELVRSGW